MSSGDATPGRTADGRHAYDHARMQAAPGSASTLTGGLTRHSALREGAVGIMPDSRTTDQRRLRVVDASDEADELRRRNRLALSILGHRDDQAAVLDAVAALRGASLAELTIRCGHCLDHVNPGEYCPECGLTSTQDGPGAA